MSTNTFTEHAGRLRADAVVTDDFEAVTAKIGRTGSVLGNAWQAYTPTVSNSTSANGSNASILGRYQIVGKTCTLFFRYTQSSVGTDGSGAHDISLPPGVTALSVSTVATAVGSATLNVNGTLSVGSAELTSTNTMILRVVNNGAGPTVWGSGFGPMSTNPLTASATATFEIA
jgi:hypothetical protein